MTGSILDTAQSQIAPHSDVEGGKGGFVLDVAVAQTLGQGVQSDSKLTCNIDSWVLKAIHIAFKIFSRAVFFNFSQPSL